MSNPGPITNNVGSPKGVLVDDPDEMFQLADLLEGVSVDCAELSSDTYSTGIDNVTVLIQLLQTKVFYYETLFALIFVKIDQ